MIIFIHTTPFESPQFSARHFRDINFGGLSHNIITARNHSTFVRRDHPKPSIINRLLDELRYGFVYIEFGFLSLAIQR